MPFEHYNAAWETPDLKPTDRLVLLALAHYADNTGQCFPSEKQIAHRAGISERTVKRAIWTLENRCLIVVAKRGNGRGRHSAYRILGKGDTLSPFQHEERVTNTTLKGDKRDTHIKRINRLKNIEYISRNSREAAALNGSEDEESEDLFGNTNTTEEPQKPHRAKRQKQSPRQPDPFRELTDTLSALWSQKYEGQKPNWRKCDFINLRKLYAPNRPEEITRRFRAFLEERSDFFAGHQLKKFISEFDHWAKPAPTAAAPATPNFHESDIPYWEK